MWMVRTAGEQDQRDASALATVLLAHHRGHKGHGMATSADDDSVPVSPAAGTPVHAGTFTTKLGLLGLDPWRMGELVSGAGIVVTLVVYGVLQERIMTRPFVGPLDTEGAEPEFFVYSVFLVLMNRLVSVFFALVAIWVTRGQIRPIAPLWAYGAVSLSNVVATTCQYEALKYISFPLQTLGKCAKMIPVMAWGVLIANKRYRVRDYGLAALVTVGCALFLATGDIGSSAQKAAGTSVAGIGLMIGYLGFDGFTSTFQGKLFDGYQMQTFNQMLYISGASSLISLLTLYSSGQLAPAMDFIARHPDVMPQVMVLSLAATCGQLFIFHTIKTSGALFFATVMTLRQFVSILLSCIIFLHPLSLGQWVGTVSVFAALYLKSQGGRGGSIANKPTNDAERRAFLSPTDEQGTAGDLAGRELGDLLERGSGPAEAVSSSTKF